MPCNVNESEKGFLDAPLDSDPVQNVMGSSFAHAAPLHQVSYQSARFALSYCQTDRQTDIQTDIQTNGYKNITSFTEVKSECVQSHEDKEWRDIERVCVYARVCVFCFECVCGDSG